MTSLPDHVVANRAVWSKFAESYADPGRRAWAKPDIDWGIWSVPEAEVGALAGLELRGRRTIELGCGTAYFSAWLAKLGAEPTGVDVTPAQLDSARRFQREFGIEFPLVEANAERTGLPDASFDIAISEYGASIWCDPDRWIPEAARLLRPGGTLVFLRNGHVAQLCAVETGITESLQRSHSALGRIEWSDDRSVEFHPPPSRMIALLRANGFEIEALIDLFPPTHAVESRFDHMTLDWARRWPSEEIWRARQRSRSRASRRTVAA
jgi:SAM-dependent methyltransferase